jgi:hypothetical protein
MGTSKNPDLSNRSAATHGPVCATWVRQCRKMLSVRGALISLLPILASPPSVSAVQVQTVPYCVEVDVPYKWDVLQTVHPDVVASTDNPTNDIVPIGIRRSRIATQDGFFTLTFKHEPPRNICEGFDMPKLPIYEGSIGYEVGYRWSCPKPTNPNLKVCGLEYESTNNMAVSGIDFPKPIIVHFFNENNLQPIQDWIFEGRYSIGKNFEPVQAIAGGKWEFPYTVRTVVKSRYSYTQDGNPTQEDFTPAQSRIRPSLVGRSRIQGLNSQDSLRYWVTVDVPGPVPILGVGVFAAYAKRLRFRKRAAKRH